MENARPLEVNTFQIVEAHHNVLPLTSLELEIVAGGGVTENNI
jgi:hypothetical protein